MSQLIEHLCTKPALTAHHSVRVTLPVCSGTQPVSLTDVLKHQTGKSVVITIQPNSTVSLRIDRASLPFLKHCEIFVMDDATAHVLDIHPHGQSDTATCCHITGNAQLTYCTLMLGTAGTVSTTTTLHNAGARFEERIAHYSIGTERLAINTYTAHNAPSTTSRILIRGAGGGSSRTRVEGRIEIARLSVSSDASLDERAVLLSAAARHESVPALTILADDVRATHASSVCHIDPEQRFFCESRGLRSSEAEALILDGMLREVCAPLPAQLRSAGDSVLNNYMYGTQSHEA